MHSNEYPPNWIHEIRAVLVKALGTFISNFVPKMNETIPHTSDNRHRMISQGHSIWSECLGHC
jgi:hypothetical protein